MTAEHLKVLQVMGAAPFAGDYMVDGEVLHQIFDTAAVAPPLLPGQF